MLVLVLVLVLVLEAFEPLSVSKTKYEYDDDHDIKTRCCDFLGFIQGYSFAAGHGANNPNEQEVLKCEYRIMYSVYFKMTEQTIPY